MSFEEDESWPDIIARGTDSEPPLIDICLIDGALLSSYSCKGSNQIGLGHYLYFLIIITVNDTVDVNRAQIYNIKSSYQGSWLKLCYNRWVNQQNIEYFQ